MILVVALCVQRVFQFQLGLGVDRPPVYWRLALVVLGMPLSVLIHEGGHWIAGLALRQRCRRFLVWPVELWREAGRWRFRVGVHRAGLVDLVPSTFAGFRGQRAIILLAGPLASAAGAALLTKASLGIADPVPFWFCSSAVLWLVIGAANLLPFRIGNVWSDGALLWHVVRGGAAFDRTQRDLLTPSSHATPLRPRDWPAGLIARIEKSPGEPLWQRFADYLWYIHLLDCGDPAVAGTHLHRLLEDWSATDAPEYALEAAYFLARHERDAAGARQWLERDPRPVDGEPWVRRRAEAAVLAAEGDAAGARQRIEEALGALRAEPSCGAKEYEADLLRGMLEAR
jgi:hypothetical protein